MHSATSTDLHVECCTDIDVSEPIAACHTAVGFAGSFISGTRCTSVRSFRGFASRLAA